MTFQEIKQLIIDQFGQEIILHTDQDPLQPSLTLMSVKIREVCAWLHENEQTYFDFLSCLTAIDNGPETGTMEVVYHLYSIPYHHFLVLKVVVPRSKPEIPTVCPIWQTANWHEREAYDLLGIIFLEHPDLRRILLPADWQGHPLRKDDRPPDDYHGIQVAY